MWNRVRNSISALHYYFKRMRQPAGVKVTPDFKTMAWKSSIWNEKPYHTRIVTGNKMPHFPHRHSIAVLYIDNKLQYGILVAKLQYNISILSWFVQPHQIMSRKIIIKMRQGKSHSNFQRFKCFRCVWKTAQTLKRVWGLALLRWVPIKGNVWAVWKRYLCLHAQRSIGLWRYENVPPYG